MVRSTLRRATKPRRCGLCQRWVYPPAQYLEVVASPDHEDLGNTTWWRSSECRECAVKYNRWPIPNGGIDPL